MTATKLVLRGVHHYWKWHLSLVFGVALASAVLSGSLVVGDSVKATLRKVAAQRLGDARVAMVGGERFFTEGLVGATMGGQGGEVFAAPVFVLRGTVANAVGDLRVNGVNIVGVDDRFWKFGDSGLPPQGWDASADRPVLNDALAARLQLGAGDTILVRAESPSALSRDAPLSGSTEDSKTTTVFRKEVAAVVGAGGFGRFSLRNEQAVPLNIFVPLAFLQEKTDREGHCNLAIFGGSDSLNASRVKASADSVWGLDDAALELRELEGSDEWELHSSRVFLGDATVVAAGKATGEKVQGVLTYLMNALVSDQGSTPYSMVAAVDPGRVGLIPEGMHDDQIVVTRWLADDLGVGVGDSVTLKYFISGKGRTLQEQGETFSVAKILPMDHPEVVPGWMPDFPGVSDTDNCRDWDPGFMVDFDRIRDKDEDYWDVYKGTPKAFVTLAAGQRLWRNRFGELTALRFPGAVTTRGAFESALRVELSLETLGFGFLDIAGDAEAAADQSQNFGVLFSALGFFLVLAALVLAGLLFAFSIDRRAGQIGMMRAVGIPGGKIKKMFVGEAMVLSFVGALLGSAAGVAYTKFTLLWLARGWSGAVAGTDIAYRATSASLLAGFFGTVFLSVGIAYLVARRVSRLHPVSLLKSGAFGQEVVPPGKKEGVSVFKNKIFIAGIAALVGAGGLALSSEGVGAAALSGIFFGVGTLLLVAGLCFLGTVLSVTSRLRLAGLGVWGLGLRNASRRRGRSLAVAGVMAAGVFLVVAVNAFRLTGEEEPGDRATGTGGFALVGESAIPVYEDMNGAVGRDLFGLDTEDMEGVRVVPLRVSEGDDASCLNLNRAQQPVVFGVSPQAFLEPESFAFTATEGGGDGWGILDSVRGDGVVPAVVDQNTALWALGKKLGDELDYPTPGGGRVRVRIVGLLAGSILQGRLLVSEKNFVGMFPGAGGYRGFLLDVPGGRVEEVQKLLTRQMRNRGLALVPAGQRLAELNAVQNTYLSIFSTLGGFGVLLGTLGLAVIVARNIMERQGELGVLRAVGFTRGRLRQLVLGEHWFLHLSGIATGTAGALVAIWPSVRAPGAALPGVLVVLVLSIIVGGLVFCWAAAAVVLRVPLISSIRKE